ncbi:MAG: VOC family protein [Acidimicrobiales bacterium]
MSTVGMIGPARMVAPVLRVRDLEVSTAWYRERLGLTPGYLSPAGAVEPLATFDLGGPLVLWQLPAGTSRHRDENDRNSHIVVVVDGPLGDVRDRLVARGVEVTEIRTGSDNEYFDLFDPDANRFEISRPRTGG